MIEKYINAASGKTQADVVLKNASYADVFCGVIRKGDIAVAGDKIVGIGNYSGREEIDCSGLTVLPGYIDGHVHIESSQLSPEEFASLIGPPRHDYGYCRPARNNQRVRNGGLRLYFKSFRKYSSGRKITASVLRSRNSV